MPGGMRIQLAYVDTEMFPVASGWTAVGFIGVGPAVMAYDAARVPHSVLDGAPTALDPVEVNRAMAQAVDVAASKLWPGGWVLAMSDVFRVHRRSLQPERLAKQGLPPGVLQALAHLSGGGDAEGLGWLMGALARYADAYAEGPNPVDRIEQAVQAARNAAVGLNLARKGKPLRPYDSETNS